MLSAPKAAASMPGNEDANLMAACVCLRGCEYPVYVCSSVHVCVYVYGCAYMPACVHMIVLVKAIHT